MLQVPQLCKHVDLNSHSCHNSQEHGIALTCGTDQAQAELQESTETFTGGTLHVLCWRVSSLIH